MIEIPIYSLGTPPSFSMSTSNDLYWLSRIAYEESYDRYNANQAGMTQKIVESSDLATMNTSVGNDVQGYLTWLGDFLDDKTLEYAENIIDMAPLITAIASGGSSEALPIMIGHLLNVLMNGAQSRNKGANDDTGELAVAQSGPLLDNFHLEINNSRKDGDIDAVWGVHTS
jgi:hypothetical protein